MLNVSVSLENKFQTDIMVRSHALRADEPHDNGGDDTGPTPSEMLLSAIGSCQAITMKLYAGRKDWPLEGIEMELTLEKVKAEQYPEFDSKGRPVIDVINTRMRLLGDLTPEQKKRIAEIGGRCPVHKTVEYGAYFSESVLED